MEAELSYAALARAERVHRDLVDVFITIAI